jgi:hypothetical protein
LQEATAVQWAVWGPCLLLHRRWHDPLAVCGAAMERCS